MSFDFENLDVWNLSISFSKAIYKVSRKFPKEEAYGITSQIRRSAVSVAANVAEGAGRYSDPDFLRFLRIARGSLYETMTLLKICFDLHLITQCDFQQLQEDGNRLGQIINGLARSLKKRN